MNHIVRGRLLLNVTLAAVLLGALLVASPQAQSIVLPLAGLMLAMIVVNTYLAARTSAQVGTLRTAALRMSTGDFSEPVPQTSEEPLANLSEILERVRKQLNQQTQEIARHLGAQSKMSGDVDGVLHDLRETIASQVSALEETSTSLHEMTTSAKQIAQSVETLARGAEESSSSILEMAASNDEVAENMVNLAGAVFVDLATDLADLMQTYEMARGGDTQLDVDRFAPTPRTHANAIPADDPPLCRWIVNVRDDMLREPLRLGIGCAELDEQRLQNGAPLHALFRVCGRGGQPDSAGRVGGGQ